LRELYTKGELGKIQFLQASHQQDMDGWPNYWPGLPPMAYATPCVGPGLALTRADAEYVSCFGSGRIREELIPKYNSPFAVETCHIKLRKSDLTARIIRFLFAVARQYRESIAVYRSHSPDHPPLFRGSRAVSRENCLLRLENVVRVAVGRARRAGAAHRQEARA